MIINFLPSESTFRLEECLKEYDNNDQIHSIIVLCCEQNGYSADQLDPILQKLKTAVFGGIFPGIIYGNQNHEIGNLVIALEDSFYVELIENLSCDQLNLENELIDCFPELDQIETMFVFVDGFAKRIGALIENMFALWGLNQNYLGGGAGSLSMKQQACIISNKGLKQDCAVIAGGAIRSGIGVKHGWESISRLYKVTAAEGTIIQQLDFKPAFAVYKDIVEKHSGDQFACKNFFEIAKAYPFGITKIDVENVVRDPLHIGNEDSLVCVGEVDPGSFVTILTGQKDSLIQAAGQAMQTAKENKNHLVEQFVFFVDCISRVLFLKEDFQEELQEVKKHAGGAPVLGVLTIGEIANNGRDYLEFYNKTSVIGCF